MIEPGRVAERPALAATGHAPATSNPPLRLPDRMKPQISHEAEVHRQHVRLKIPIFVEFGGRRYEVDDWSMGGFGIESKLEGHRPGATLTVKMIFPFDGFELSMRLPCEVVYVVAGLDRFGCRFLTLNQGQLALFRYLVDAYLSGEVVTAGDILRVRGQDPALALRETPVYDPYAEPPSRWARARHALGLVLASVVGLGLIGLIWLGLEERYFRLEVDDAVVTVPSSTLVAPAASEVAFYAVDVGASVAAGDALGSLTTLDGGRTVVLNSPCDCVVREIIAARGQNVPAGGTLIALAAADRPVTIEARLPLDQTTRIATGDDITWQFAGEAPRAGAITRVVARQSGNDAEAGRARVVIRPDRPLELDDVGRYASVRFR